MSNYVILTVFIVRKPWANSGYRHGKKS